MHGDDGMGDIGLALHGRVPAAATAAEVLVDEIRARPGEVTLVTLGPLTNVAAALELAPDIATQLRSLVVMGGTSDAPATSRRSPSTTSGPTPRPRRSSSSRARR